MLPIVPNGSIVGRIFPAYVADTAGPLNVFTFCTVVAGMFGFCWIPIYSTVAGLIIWSLLYEAFSGEFISPQPSIVVSILNDIDAVGGRLGMNTFRAALGVRLATR
jgi:hypothetical protein